MYLVCLCSQQSWIVILRGQHLLNDGHQKPVIFPERGGEGRGGEGRGGEGRGGEGRGGEGREGEGRGGEGRGGETGSTHVLCMCIVYLPKHSLLVQEQ